MSLLLALLGWLGVAPATYAANTGQKAPIRGLVTMGRLGFMADPSMQPDNSLREANAHPGLYAGAVIIATWGQLEPSQGHYDFSAIETGLNNIRAYNRRYPKTPLAGKLRVFSGTHAPDWVLRLDGGPVTVTSERGGESQIGHFWSPPYRAAWRELQNHLAARFDNDPLVQEVAISSCASSSAEPFVIPLNGPNAASVISGGYSDAAMQSCLIGAIDDYAAWTQVAIDYTFNPWRSIATGHPRPAPGFTESVMRKFRARFGQRGVIANHGLTPEVNPGAQSVLDTIRTLGGPIEFQTRSPQQDWPASVRTGEQYGVTELEIWDTHDAGGPAPVSADNLRQWRSELMP